MSEFLENEIENLRKENEDLQKEYEGLKWGVQKTNEAIKTLYKDLERKNKELQNLDQLKSDFVSTVSHELRTPLAISTEGINLIIDGIVGPITDQQKELLTMSKESLYRLNRIINDLLDISKIESGKMDLKLGPVNFKGLLEKLTDSYQKVLDTKKQELKIFFPKEPVYLYADGDKLIQVVTNLLNNAHKFTPEGGSIKVVLKREKDGVLCRVQDSGIGIAQEDMRKLFGKFQQFGRTYGPGIKGTGLGLAICKSLIELHKGKIWAESSECRGTTFFFRLPGHSLIQEDFKK